MIMMANDIRGWMVSMFSPFVLQLRIKPHPEKMTQEGIEPGAHYVKGNMLPLDHKQWSENKQTAHTQRNSVSYFQCHKSTIK